MDYKIEIIKLLDKASKKQLYILYQLIIEYLD